MFRKDLWRKLELKLKPSSNLLPHYLVKCKRSTKQFYIHSSKNNKLHVRQHVSGVFICLFVFFSSRHWCLCNIIAIFCWSGLVMPFHYEDKLFSTAWNNKQWKKALRDANTACVLAVVRFGHRPPARPPARCHKPTDRTDYNTLHCS